MYTVIPVGSILVCKQNLSAFVHCSTCSLPCASEAEIAALYHQSKVLLQSWATHQGAVTYDGMWKVSHVFQVLKAWFWPSRKGCEIFSHPLVTGQKRKTRMLLWVWTKEQGWSLTAESGQILSWFNAGVCFQRGHRGLTCSLNQQLWLSA